MKLDKSTASQIISNTYDGWQATERRVATYPTKENLRALTALRDEILLKIKKLPEDELNSSTLDYLCQEVDLGIEQRKKLIVNMGIGMVRTRIRNTMEFILLDPEKIILENFDRLGLSEEEDAPQGKVKTLIPEKVSSWSKFEKMKDSSSEGWTSFFMNLFRAMKRAGLLKREELEAINIDETDGTLCNQTIINFLLTRLFLYRNDVIVKNAVPSLSDEFYVKLNQPTATERHLRNFYLVIDAWMAVRPEDRANLIGLQKIVEVWESGRTEDEAISEVMEFLSSRRKDPKA